MRMLLAPLALGLLASTLLAEVGEIPAGFTPIFNGSHLAGWHISRTNHHGSTEDWRILDGVLTGTQDKPGHGGILLSDDRYTDFEAYLEINSDCGCDSGVLLRSNETAQAYQAMLDYLEGGWRPSFSQYRGQSARRGASQPLRL